MKHYLYCMLFASVMLFASCENGDSIHADENISETTETQECYQLLQSDIRELNSSLTEPQTRSFLSRLFGRVLKVFVADCVGAIKGAFNGDNVWQSAQGASLASAKKQLSIIAVDAVNTYITRSITSDADNNVTQLLQPRTTALEGLILVDNPVSATLDDSIGYYHNAIIYTTLENNNSINYWKNVSDYSCVLQLNNELANALPTYNDTIVNQETINLCSYISNQALESPNYKHLLTASANNYPEIANMLNTASIFFEGMELVTTDEEWEDYCKRILKLVSESNIPEKDKNALKKGIIVGYASSKLWNPESY